MGKEEKPRTPKEKQDNNRDAEILHRLERKRAAKIAKEIKIYPKEK